MSEPQTELRFVDLLEPGIPGHLPLETAVALSQAVSLKRIADRMEATGPRGISKGWDIRTPTDGEGERTHFPIGGGPA